MSLNPLWLPVSALRLAGRFLLPLFLWFSAGQLARFGLIRLGANVARGDSETLRRVLTVTIFVILVLVVLATTVGMLHTLRRGMRSLRRHPTQQSDDFFDTLTRALLPFVVVYFVWNIYIRDARDFMYADVKRTLGEVAGDSNILFVLDLRVALVVTGVVWLARVVCKRRYERNRGRITGLVVAFFEACFGVFALSSVLELFRRFDAWLTDRVVWAWGEDLFATLGKLVPGWNLLWGHVGDFTSWVKDGLILPLVWLLIAALIYGRDLPGLRALVTGTRLEPAAGWVTGMSSWARRGLAWLTANERDKYVPVIVAGRMVLRAGARVLAAFVLCYGLAEYIARLAWFAATGLIGSHDQAFWHVAIVPVDFGRNLVHEVLRLAVLAATVDLVARRTAAKDRTEPTVAAASSADRASS